MLFNENGCIGPSNFESLFDLPSLMDTGNDVITNKRLSSSLAKTLYIKRYFLKRMQTNLEQPFLNGSTISIKFVLTSSLHPIC